MATKATATKDRPLEAVEVPDDEPTPAPDPNTATVTLEWRGVKFSILKRRGRWPVRALREFNRGRNIEGLVALIGEDGWTVLERICPTSEEFEEFSDYAGEVIQRECVP